MITFIEYLTESKRSTQVKWRDHTPTEAKHPMISGVDHSNLKHGDVVELPHSYFTSDKHFEPYHLRELESGKTDDGYRIEPRVKRMHKAIKDGKPLPYLIATKHKNKIHVLDGFTRAGVAIAHGSKIYAKVIK